MRHPFSTQVLVWGTSRRWWRGFSKFIWRYKSHRTAANTDPVISLFYTWRDERTRNTSTSDDIAEYILTNLSNDNVGFSLSYEKYYGTWCLLIFCIFNVDIKFMVLWNYWWRELRKILRYNLVLFIFKSW